LIPVNLDIASRIRNTPGNEGTVTAVQEKATTTTVVTTGTKDTMQTLMSFSNGEQSEEITSITQTTTTMDIQIPNANDIVVSKLIMTTNAQQQQQQRNLTDHVNDNDHHDLHNNNNGDSIMYEPDDEHDEHDEHDDIRNDSDSIRRMMDLYDIVGVEPTASIKEIDNAFLEALKYFRQFCDKLVDSTLYDLDKEIAVQKHMELVNAYALLSDPIKRRDYDIIIQQQERLRRLRVRQQYKKLDAKEAITKIPRAIHAITVN
jgi:hypothetical protein